MSMTATTMQTRASASFGNVIAMTVSLRTSDARVARGQAAWSRIKATAGQTRQDWLDVGAALKDGRDLYPGKKNDRNYGQWLIEHGFDDIHPRARSASIWLTGLMSETIADIPVEINHPVAIQAWFGKFEKEQELKVQVSSIPEELRGEKVTVETRTNMTHGLAVKVSKLANREKAGDEGSPMATRGIDAFAKQEGVTREVLLKDAAEKAPEAFYQFTPAQVEALQEIRESVLATIPELERDGLSREAIAAVFANVANAIRTGEI